MWWFGVVLPSVFRFYASFQFRLCVLISIRRSSAALIFSDAPESKEHQIIIKKNHTSY
jgi:hypothetical protein